MAILVDFTPIIISAVNAGDKAFGENLTEGIIRHLSLNMILSFKKQFSEKFGRMIICIDSGNVWRKDYFPHYKFSRRKSREDSPLDWELIFSSIKNLVQEMKDYLPYHVIECERCEADDVIGTLVEYFESNELIADGFDLVPQNTVIISRDKDFKQLHKKNVVQWNPLEKKWIRELSPTNYLIEQIIKGDSSDGVPNILSQDDSFVLKIRQKPIRQTYIDNIIKNGITEDIKERYNRNKQLVDLSMIPSEYKNKIIENYKSYKPQPKSRLLNYIVDKQLKNLYENIQYF